MVHADASIVRLDQALISEMATRIPEIETIANGLHQSQDHFSRLAAIPFCEPSMQELLGRGASRFEVNQGMLRLFQRILILRTAALLPTAIRSINNAELIPFALSARGVLETAAFAAYHSRKLALPLDASAIPSDYEVRLAHTLTSGRFDWVRFVDARLELLDEYDQKKPPASESESATNIVTMIGKLGDRLAPRGNKGRGVVKLSYALLSDICHPAAGSHGLFISQVQPQFRVELEPSKPTLRAIAKTVLPCLIVSTEALGEVLDELGRLEVQIGSLAPKPAS